MSDEIIVQYASPTLAGIKTGSLFTCPCTDRKQTMLEIRSLNRKLVPKGLRILPLRYSAERVLVYLYRPARLEKDLSNKEALEKAAADRAETEMKNSVLEKVYNANEIDIPDVIPGLYLRDCLFQNDYDYNYDYDWRK